MEPVTQKRENPNELPHQRTDRRRGVLRALLVPPAGRQNVSASRRCSGRGEAIQGDWPHNAGERDAKTQGTTNARTEMKVSKYRKLPGLPYWSG